jgi:hypothetical protein
MRVPHLSDSNDFAIGAPASLLKELRYLSSLAGSSLTDDNCYWVRLDQIQQALTVLGDRQQSGGFV